MEKLPFAIDLKGKVAVVTGGTGVLCSGFVDALAECGAAVAVLSRNLQEAEAKAAEVEARGGRAIGVAADVLDKAALKAAHERILAELGPCDILINGAGGNHPGATTTEEYWEPEHPEKQDENRVGFFDLETEGLNFVLDVNFLGTLLPCQEFAPDMAGRKGATVVNISSMNAYTPLTKIPAYSGAKAAVSNFTQWLAVHFSKAGIRVNAIAPGFFLTAQNEKLLKNADGTLTERSAKILGSTPMGRFGEAQELVGTLLFLVSEEAASFVNGVIIPVDGAFSAYSGV